MSVTQTMEPVHRYVPTHQDHDSVAAGLGSDWLVMAGLVQVGSSYAGSIAAVRLMSEIDFIHLLYYFHSIDINECNQNNGDCLHICDNIPGSRVCRCRPGFVLDTDGRTCLGWFNITGIIATMDNRIFILFLIDIDECNTNNGDCAQTCTNTQGSHQCSCRSGFTPASNGRICQG